MKTPLDELPALVIEAALEKKAFNILVLDLRNRSDITDYFIICSGNSKAQVQAIVNSILEKTYETSFRPAGIEGLSTGNWVILDIEDVFVHVFQKEVRSYYDLERLWGDVPVTEIEAAAN
ncbi:MAG: ribosome silencing factor [Nitrospinales bacterium]